MNVSDVTRHEPVLLAEVVEAFAYIDKRQDKPLRIFDATLGGGGHSEALLSAYEDLEVIAIDRDDEAIERTRKRLEQFSGRLQIMQGTFADIGCYSRELFPGESAPYAGVIADLGISSDQLDSPERGFHFAASALWT